MGNTCRSRRQGPRAGLRGCGWTNRRPATAKTPASWTSPPLLPVELSEQQRDQLVKRFVRELTNGQVPWLAAIHDKGKDAANPHVHLVVRDRHIEHGKRALGMSEKAALSASANSGSGKPTSLAMAGLEERIDRRSLEEQRAEKLALAEEWREKSPEVAAAYEAEAATLDRKPQASVGPTPRAIDAKGKKSTVMRRVRREEAGPLGKRISRPGIDRSPSTPQKTPDAPHRPVERP